ncbi:MAG: hypothetical protein FJ271_12965 [Planctomycetes bacterium]|nr:hypothetical protein [Planctomycetota bacterium]
MKTITVPPRSAEINALLQEAKVEDLIVRTESGDEFMLTAVGDFDREICQTRRNAKLMTLLDQRAKQTQTISLDNVKHRLGLSK